MSILTNVARWFGLGGWALSDRKGDQRSEPSSGLGDTSPMASPDNGMQIAAVWACVERISTTVATLPIFVYQDVPGQPGRRTQARGSSLFDLLHESPNGRMTPCEFWTALLLNLMLRGNGYARIQRGARGEAVALWPMSADQVVPVVLDDGTVVYEYTIAGDVAVLAAANVLHIKGMGNGTKGLSRLDYMRTTLDEARNAQLSANKLFGRGGKPTGVLMVDAVLDHDKRKQIEKTFGEMAAGNTGCLFVLEASMKYQQLSLTPEDMQLLSTRQFSKSEIGTWFGVPSILINQTEGTTTLGSSAAEIIESFYKLTIRPLLVNIEQALRKRVMTPAERATLTVEFSQDALLRASLKDRAAIYAQLTQNATKCASWKTTHRSPAATS